MHFPLSLTSLPSFLSSFLFPSFFSLINITGYHTSDWIIYAKSLICWFLLNPFLSRSQTNEGKWHKHKDNLEFPLHDKEIQSGADFVSAAGLRKQSCLAFPRGFATGGNCCWGYTEGSRDMGYLTGVSQNWVWLQGKGKEQDLPKHVATSFSFYSFPFLGNFS